MRISLSLLAVVVWSPALGHAQGRQTLRPIDRLTVAGSFGGLSSAGDLNSDGSAGWRPGWAASFNATYWILPRLGVRASGMWAQDSLRGIAPSLEGRRRFNKFFYDGEAVVRLTDSTGHSRLFPYFLAGAGAVTVHHLGSTTTWTKFAGNFGAGVQYNIGRWGARAEVRDQVYRFARYDFQKTEHDVAWQASVSLTL